MNFLGAVSGALSRITRRGAGKEAKRTDGEAHGIGAANAGANAGGSARVGSTEVRRVEREGR